jgi:hypothetical protein
MKQLRSRLALIATMASVVSAADLPKLTDVSVSANIMLSGNTFTYAYTVTNSSRSIGSIWTVSVDIAQSKGGASVSGDGLVNGPGFLVDSSTAVLARSEAVQMLPVAGQCPPGWVCSLAIDGHVVWGADSQNALILPGATVSGYQLTSRGLPGIRTFICDPFLDVGQLPIAPPSGPSDLNRYDKQLAELEASVRFQGSTVGPTAPPTHFVPVDFLKTVQSYKDEALKQGWIKNAGIGNSLDAKLGATGAALARGDNTAAKNQLNALLNEVDAQAGKQLTSEAVSLLQFNTQYLISRIP